MVATQWCTSYALRNYPRMVSNQSTTSAVADANGTQGDMASAAVNAHDVDFVLSALARLVTQDV